MSRVCVATAREIPGEISFGAKRGEEREKKRWNEKGEKAEGKGHFGRSRTPVSAPRGSGRGERRGYFPGVGGPPYLRSMYKVFCRKVLVL